MKPLKPHSKCCTACSAIYTEEFWRRFWAAWFASLSFFRLHLWSLRIIPYSIVRILFPKLTPCLCPGYPSQTYSSFHWQFLKDVRAPGPVMFVWLRWHRAKALMSPSLSLSLSFSIFSLTHGRTPSPTNCPFIVKDCLTLPCSIPASGFQVWPVLRPANTNFPRSQFDITCSALSSIKLLHCSRWRPSQTVAIVTFGPCYC